MVDYWDEKMKEDNLNPYTKCELRRAQFCKCKDGVQHKFLVIFFGHWNHSSADLNPEDNSSKQSSGLISPSSSENNAYDSMYIVGSPRDASQSLTYTMFDKD